MKAALKHAALALIGGCIYYAIEIAWRGHSHWTMAVLGGVCFVLVGGINEYFPWSMSLALQGAIGAAIITALEFVAGVVLNVWLGLGIWDYSALPFNVLGQICLPFTLAWVPLAVVAVVVDDWLRYFLFGEEKPHYVLLKGGESNG